MKKKILSYITLVLSLCFIVSGCNSASESISFDEQMSNLKAYQSQMSELLENEEDTTIEETTEVPTTAKVEPTTQKPATDNSSVSLSDIPAFSNKPYVEINDNKPEFLSSDLTTSSYEYYSDLDSLGRCGVAVACIGQDIMPTEKRGEIGQVKPTGWHTVKYDCVDGKYLYNRCHLIGYQLSGENANEKNLITGTRYLNVDGMLPFENMVADYVKETNNHVLYRVTPIFKGDNLLANGVQMEAFSVEDDGDGICFNVFCYNAQPKVTIDYKTGDSSYKGGGSSQSSKSSSSQSNKSNSSSVQSSQQQNQNNGQSGEYVLNTNTKKFHYPSCSSAKRIKDSNKQSYSGSRDDLIAQGYDPCKKCNP